MGYPKWTDIPACEGTDSESWFTVDDSTTYKNESTLRKICANCPVRSQCFDYALNHVVDGYWAGTTPRVRQQMRKRLNIIPQLIYSSWEHYGA